MDLVKIYKDMKKNGGGSYGRGRAEEIRQIIRAILDSGEEYVVVRTLVDVLQKKYREEKRDKLYMAVEGAVKTKSSGLRWTKKDGMAVIIKA